MRRKLVTYVPLGFVLALLAAELVYIELGKLPLDHDKILYGAILIYRTTSFYLLLAAVLGFVWVVAGAVNVRGRLNRTQDILYAIAVVGAFVALPLGCWASIHLIVEFGSSFKHLDRFTFDREIYQLAYYAQPTSNISSYNLYHCDTLGWACDRVFQIDTAAGTPHEELGNFRDAHTAHLVSEDGQLAVVVNGTRIGSSPRKIKTAHLSEPFALSNCYAYACSRICLDFSMYSSD